MDAGLVCRIAYDVDVSPEEKQSGKQPSIWAVMAEAESDLAHLADDPSLAEAAIARRVRPSGPTIFPTSASYIRWLPRSYRTLDD